MNEDEPSIASVHGASLRRMMRIPGFILRFFFGTLDCASFSSAAAVALVVHSCSRRTQASKSVGILRAYFSMMDKATMECPLC